jgi:hypothetical protein
VGVGVGTSGHGRFSNLRRQLGTHLMSDLHGAAPTSTVARPFMTRDRGAGPVTGDPLAGCGGAPRDWSRLSTDSCTTDMSNFFALDLAVLRATNPWGAEKTLLRRAPTTVGR